MIIYDIQEKGKNSARETFSRLFLPILILLVISGSYGIYKLIHIEKAKVPVSIEYATSTPPIQQAQQKPENKIQSSVPKGVYVGSRGGTSYYLPTCIGAKKISEKNKIWFESKTEAERLGYKPAKTCKELFK